MDDAAQNTARPDPADFDDYRAFLAAMVEHLRETEPRFSYRWFARRAGFSSPNFLKLVADGDRAMSADSIDRFARGLGLDERETRHFEALVRMGIASTDGERRRWYEVLRDARRRSPVGRLAADAFDLYARWWVVVVRELVGLSGFREDTRWIARMLRPAIDRAQARDALGLLERLGLLRREGGRLAQAERKISTGGEVHSLAVRTFHRAMLEHAARALDTVPRDRRSISALTVPLTAEQYAAVRARVDAFRRTLLEDLDEAGPEAAAAIYQVQFVLFPVTEEVDP